jgi:hypothetical protein
MNQVTQASLQAGTQHTSPLLASQPGDNHFIKHALINTFDRTSTTLKSSETLLESWVTSVWMSDIANSVAVSEDKQVQSTILSGQNIK